MSKKAEFIKFVETLLENSNIQMSDEANEYWLALQQNEEKEKPMFTDNGKLILQYLKDNQNITHWKSRDIAEGLFISSRSVSGTMRKLVSDGFVARLGDSPIVYSLTDLGKEIEII